MTSSQSLKDVIQHDFPPSLAQLNQRGSSLPEEALPSGATTPTSTRPSSTTAFTAALPPVDTGYAWTFLAAGFVIETLAFGFTFSIGVFHEYWTTVLFPEASSAATITLATTLCSGLMYITAVIIGPIFTRYPEYRAQMQYGGLALSVAGLIACAFATKPWHLVVTAGLMYPLGGCTYYFPAATLLFSWWQRKRGFAAGVMYSGTGIGGAVFPFIMQGLLNRFSYKAAVISLAVGYGIFGIVAVYFIRERIPVPRRNRQSANDADAPARRVPLTFIKRNTFYAFVFSILFTSLGNFIPSIYLPSYATDLGLSQTSGTLLVVMMNASSVVGLLLLGHLSDRWPARVVITISCMGSALSCFLLWGFATSVSVLVVFALLFGFFALGYAAVWNRLITIISRDDPLLPPVIFSVFAFARGIGSILSGPISTALLKKGGLGHAAFGYGVGDYGGLLIWTGSVIALGSVAGVSYRDT
ncbi:MFS general substrate transporter [Cystobasidium minutum MCA 4210]|uniref:MFS general substrate transporter n=1 Tax=Cystobasidium minutum MCA 4210 TaxID=1397322 RepID=UPI0034CF8982|eukprot:jgi/Rhomi1/150718/estExt_Genewise1.C_2_t40057